MAERIRALAGVVPGVFADTARAEAAIGELMQRHGARCIQETVARRKASA